MKEKPFRDPKRTKKYTLDYYKKIIDKKIKEGNIIELKNLEKEVFSLLKHYKKLSKRIQTEMYETYYLRKTIFYLYDVTNCLSRKHL